jgi:molybdopterin synthase catalytic subunit
MFDVVQGPIDAEAVRRAVAEPSARKAGAVVVFHGTVRDETRGRRVRFLEYEAYRPMAVSTLEAVARDAARAHGLSAVACVHRVGRLDPGEVAVVVAVAAPHRAAALQGVEAFVSRMKRDVPIWKKEHFEDGAVWVGSPDDPQGERATVPA